MQINELAELRDQTYETSYIYKERTKLTHDAKLIPINFALGDKVLLCNSRFKKFTGKFRSRWSGPFKVTHAFSLGAVKLEGPIENFKVNGRRLKAYVETSTGRNISSPLIHSEDMTEKLSFYELSGEKRERALCDIEAKNIVMQAILYVLFENVDSNTTAKDVWDEIKRQ
ncbi:uncharacterized protein [Rutidosis leptorrhynchoides]|uniref:uncharacterized protein n=1 Tax=Rutidosis leptorrhynchoides TaxID=125765 RepID=UPI003A99416A